MASDITGYYGSVKNSENILTDSESSLRSDNLSSKVNICKSRRIIINLFGPPGSGKGTQGQLLAQNLHIPHLSIGDLFRKEERENSSIGKLIALSRQYQKSYFVPDEVTYGILLKRISQDDCQRGFILDGFPRTPEQCKVYMSFLRPSDIHIPILFSISPEDVIARLRQRYICSQCGTQYKIEKEKNCPTCCIPLHQREDDASSERIVQRLQFFRTKIPEILTTISKRDHIHYISNHASFSPQDISKEVNHTVQQNVVRASNRDKIVKRGVVSGACLTAALFLSIFLKKIIK